MSPPPPRRGRATDLIHVAVLSVLVTSLFSMRSCVSGKSSTKQKIWAFAKVSDSKMDTKAKPSRNFLDLKNVGNSNAPPIILPLNHGFFNVTLPLQSPSGHRRGLVEARVWLNGHVLTQGYYYTYVTLGSPGQEFALIVDTGSTVTYVPCASCIKCGTHQDNPFVPSQSTTYQDVPCKGDLCEMEECDKENRCMYARHYAEESSSSGYLVSDFVHFGEGSNLPAKRVVFGCETSETGDLYSQRADGIFALGRGRLGVVDQLVQEGGVSSVFSLCYGGMDEGGGSMIIGESFSPPEMHFTPFETSRGEGPYYNVIIEQFSVGGKPLGVSSEVFDQGYGAVLDSGTTFTYLPEEAFLAFKKAIQDGVTGLHPVPGPDPNYQDVDVCYGGASQKMEELYSFFPTVSILFKDDLLYNLSPENFLFRHRSIDGAYCLGIFQNGREPGTLLGGILTRNTMVTYDRVKERVGFWKVDCNNLFKSLNSMEGPPSQTRPLPVHPPKSSSDNSEESSDSSSEETSEKNGNGCGTCTARIVIKMQIQISLPDFESISPTFVTDLQRALKLDPREEAQVVLDDYDQVESVVPVAVTVVVCLVPFKTPVISDPVVKRVEAALKNEKFVLREAFNTYKVQSFDAIPLPPPRSGSPSTFWIPLIGGLSVLLLVGLIVLAVLLVRKWQRKKEEQNSYRSVELEQLNST